MTMASWKRGDRRTDMSLSPFFLGPLFIIPANPLVKKEDILLLVREMSSELLLGLVPGRCESLLVS